MTGRIILLSTSNDGRELGQVQCPSALVSNASFLYSNIQFYVTNLLTVPKQSITLQKPEQ